MVPGGQHWRETPQGPFTSCIFSFEVFALWSFVGSPGARKDTFKNEKRALQTVDVVALKSFCIQHAMDKWKDKASLPPAGGLWYSH